MRAVMEELVPPTLRFYAWNPPCISVGYSQSLAAEIDLARCRRDGVDWVRRPTGGRAILHTDELTYSIVLSQDDPRAFGGVVESYRHLSRGLVSGLDAVEPRRCAGELPGEEEPAGERSLFRYTLSL